MSLIPLKPKIAFSIFGVASLILFIETHFLIPYLTKITGIESILYWFIVAGIGMFLPLVIVAYFILKNEGYLNAGLWNERLRFKKMTLFDWKWTIAGILLIILISGTFKFLTGLIFDNSGTTPPFLSLEPLTPDRYWLLAVWFPYWLLNIMGEEILWRGVMLPRQEIAHGKNAWWIHSLGWTVFHLSFGLSLLITMLPILFIQPFVVTKCKNSWTGVIIHAFINGPSFILIAFGIL